MTWTYDISDTTDISSMMRLELGDTEREKGILPEDGNFSDEELDYFYTQEDDNFWLAVARAFDAAASKWAAYPDSFYLGPEHQKIPAATLYSQKAANIRTKQLSPGVYSVSKDEIAMDLD
jgi:hypothetical protein